jgi:hypothetical protein
VIEAHQRGVKMKKLVVVLAVLAASFAFADEEVDISFASRDGAVIRLKDGSVYRIDSRMLEGDTVIVADDNKKITNLEEDESVEGSNDDQQPLPYCHSPHLLSHCLVSW